MCSFRTVSQYSQVSPRIASLSEFRALLKTLPQMDQGALEAARSREPQLTKPRGSLGRLEEIAAWMSAWQGRNLPRLENVRCVIFAGNHGVARLGVSAFPAEVTRQMVANYQAGGAAINQLCKANGIDLDVVVHDLDCPTADFTQGPAMSEAEVVAALNAGLKAGSKASDLLCLGEMGIANTTSASALCAGLYGGDGKEWVGTGSGVIGAALQKKIEVVDQAMALHRSVAGDSLELLRCVGGRELAGMAAAVIGARLNRIPVMLDGFICTAAAAVMEDAVPGALDHCLVAHASEEQGHGKLVEKLGKKPLLQLGLRLGEGSGAAVAVSIVRSAVACHTGMSTFAQAGVSESPL